MRKSISRPRASAWDVMSRNSFRESKPESALTSIELATMFTVIDKAHSKVLLLSRAERCTPGRIAEVAYVDVAIGDIFAREGELGIDALVNVQVFEVLADRRAQSQRWRSVRSEFLIIKSACRAQLLG